MFEDVDFQINEEEAKQEVHNVMCPVMFADEGFDVDVTQVSLFVFHSKAFDMGISRLLFSK